MTPEGYVHAELPDGYVVFFGIADALAARVAHVVDLISKVSCSKVSCMYIFYCHGGAAGITLARSVYTISLKSQGHLNLVVLLSIS